MADLGKCIFCDIANGRQDSRKLGENEVSICILDIGQTGKGRSLVIPKRHVTWFYELEDEEVAQSFILAKRMAQKIARAFNPDFLMVLIRGQRVPHAHIILQPTFEDDAWDNAFKTIAPAWRQPSAEELDDMAQKIREA